jgi:hypothetical protein
MITAGNECAPEIRQRQFPSMLRFDATGRAHQWLKIFPLAKNFLICLRDSRAVGFDRSGGSKFTVRQAVFDYAVGQDEQAAVD